MPSTPNLFSIDCIAGCFYILLCVFAGRLRTPVQLNHVVWQCDWQENEWLELRAWRSVAVPQLPVPVAGGVAAAAGAGGGVGGDGSGGGLDGIGTGGGLDTGLGGGGGYGGSLCGETTLAEGPPVTAATAALFAEGPPEAEAVAAAAPAAEWYDLPNPWLEGAAAAAAAAAAAPAAAAAAAALGSPRREEFLDRLSARMQRHLREL